jgi:deoxyribonuclease V
MRSKALHPWDVTPTEARRIQLSLRRKLGPREPLKRVKTIAAGDVSFKDDRAYAAVAVFSYPELNLLEEAFAEQEVRFAYIPGLLTFREGPALLLAFQKIRTEPDVILFDGQGEAHPLGMGEATHLGILLDRPSIGVAKSRLYGKCEEPGEEKGSRSFLLAEGRVVGAALRTRMGAKPVFVSPGHLLDLDSAVETALSCSPKYRIPEPLRYVHSSSVKRAETRG